MKLVCVSYRQWALKIYKKIQETELYNIHIIDSKETYSDDLIYQINPDYVLFYGWSWFVPEQLLKDYKCLMLHPSPLPKYRGGSPLQNQIIAGEKKLSTKAGGDSFSSFLLLG